MSLFAGVAERQTRTVQVRVVAILCGFKSHLLHTYFKAVNTVEILYLPLLCFGVLRNLYKKQSRCSEGILRSNFCESFSFKEQKFSFYQILNSYSKNSCNLRFLLSFPELLQSVGNERFLWRVKISVGQLHPGHQ